MNDRGGVGSQGSPEGGVDRVHAARSVAWGGVESAAGALTGLVVTPLIVRAFGLEGLGLWAASWSLAHSAGLFDLGIGASYARFTASAIARHDVRDLNGAVAAGIGFHLAVAAVFALLAFSVGPFVIIHLSPTDAMRPETAWILSSACAVVLLRLVLVHQGSTLRWETIEASRRLGARCVNWFSDYPSEFDEGLAVMSSYDPFLHGARHTDEHRARCLTDPRCGGKATPEKPGALVGIAGGASA